MIRRLVFHHINKCAGTTLLYALQDRFRHDECVFMERYYSRENFTEFDYPDFEEIARARFIHEPSGSRNWKSILPNVSTFAMLRDPVDRLCSQWMMVRQWSAAEAEKRKNTGAIHELARSGFESFLASDDPNIILDRWNGMTGYLLLGNRAIIERWRSLEIMRNPALAREALDLAISNLESLDFIGLVERFEDSLDALAVDFPFSRDREAQAHNVRGSGTYRSSLDPEVLALAESATALDDRLYTVARDRFARQIGRLRKEYGSDLKAAAASRHEAAFREPPDWVLVSMGDALRGSGWHAREVNGMKMSRWMGPGPIATIDVDVEKARGLFIRARCTSFVDPLQLAGFKMSADKVPLNVGTWVLDGRYRYFEAVVSGDLLRPNTPLHLEFDCGFVLRSGNPGDPRQLGLEFSEIEVGPASGFRQGEPGTPIAASHRC